MYNICIYVYIYVYICIYVYLRLFHIMMILGLLFDNVNGYRKQLRKCQGERPRENRSAELSECHLEMLSTSVEAWSCLKAP